MKNKIKNFLAILCFGCVLVTLAPGCKSPGVAATAIKGEGIIITTVDTGMKLWAVYVNVGKATQDQVDQVKKFYVTYYNAQLMAEAALQKYIATGSADPAEINAANAAVLAAQTPLLTILNQYIK